LVFVKQASFNNLSLVKQLPFLWIISIKHKQKRLFLFLGMIFLNFYSFSDQLS
jgi:hypothetical protein